MKSPSSAGDPASKGHRAILVVACLAQFMVVLDVSIVNVALPSIRESLGMSATSLQWVVNIYAITFAGFLLLGGRCADLFGRKRLFITGVTIFTLASLAGGFAADGWQLIAARGLQGFGGAILAPATLTLLATTFTDPHERAKAFGVWGAVAGAGGAFGALAGGVLTDALSWRWILFVNVPIGVGVGIAALYYVTELRHDREGRSLDLLGAISVTAGIMAVVFGIVTAESEGWGSTKTIASLVAGALLLVLFVIDQAKLAKDPLVPLRIFRSRTVAAANVVVFMAGSAMFAMFFFLSLYLQQVRGYTPTHTGVAFLPLALSIIVAANFIARRVHALGPRTPLVIGMSMVAIGLAWLSQLSETGDYWTTIFPPIVLLGLGLGCNMASVTIAGTSGVPRHEAGLASGLLNTSRQVGGALGLAALSTIAESHAKDLLQSHTVTATHALMEGFTRAFAVASVLAVIGVVAALAAPGRPRRPLDQDETTDLVAEGMETV
jgi:EmrB/QacA subfamily drug resistance transporter